MKHSSDNYTAGSAKSIGNIENLFGKEAAEDADLDFDDHINKSLSLVLHHDDVREMVAIIKKLTRDRTNKRS